ncbi:hypothetical protein J4455_04040 [Candidatus Woesearchaeota archaeon]|nr:hypothetical protein [Candidatus Woesearchaeota archaeon]
MLTISRIREFAEEDGRIVFRAHPQNKGLKALWCPDNLEIRVYTCNIESTRDLDITIVHEFIHVAEDFSETIARAAYESEVKHDKIYDLRARRILRERPYILKFIKELYNLKY